MRLQSAGGNVAAKGPAADGPRGAGRSPRFVGGRPMVEAFAWAAATGLFFFDLYPAWPAPSHVARPFLDSFGALRYKRRPGGK